MSAYAGKEDGRRLEPARLGYVGEAPGDFWEQAVAQVEAGTAASGAEGVVAYLRRHAAEIGGGPSMGIMEAEQQHMYKVRMGSFPCAWSPAGADAMARLRSWLGSGFALPPRTRESERSPRCRKRRERKLAKHLARQAGGRVKSEGKGWEYPLTASLGASGPTSATRWPAPRWGGDQHLLYVDKWKGN